MAVATHSTALRLSLRAAALRRSVPAIGSRSKTSGLQDFLVLGGDLHLRDGIPPGPRSRGLLLVEGLALDLALALQALDEVLVLLAIEGVRDGLEALQAVECSRPARCLVRHHAANRAPQNLGRRTLVEGTVARIRVGFLALEVRILELGTVERIGDVDVLGTNTDHLLPVEELLRHQRAEAAEEMAAAIDDHLLFEGHSSSGELGARGGVGWDREAPVDRAHARACSGGQDPEPIWLE